jgi:hypothetical protein
MLFGTMWVMKYVVLMYSDPAQTKAMSTADREAVRRRHEALHADEAAAMLNGAGLASTAGIGPWWNGPSPGSSGPTAAVVNCATAAWPPTTPAYTTAWPASTYDACSTSA